MRGPPARPCSGRRRTNSALLPFTGGQLQKNLAEVGQNPVEKSFMSSSSWNRGKVATTKSKPISTSSMSCFRMVTGLAAAPTAWVRSEVGDVSRRDSALDAG